MKIAFISDIHGNATALEAVLAHIREQAVDRVYVLGDLCYRGPAPKRSLELVQALQTSVIKGNADEWVVRGVRQGEVADAALELMNQERDWTVSQLGPEDLEYLASLPSELHLEHEGVSIHAFHATPDSLFDIVAPGSGDEVLQTKLMSAAEADLYVYAHIHKPYIRYLDGRIVINIGSVGLPFDGLPRASYGLIEIADGSLSTRIERVAFDIEQVVSEYEEARYPNAEMMTRIVRKASVKS